MYNVLSKNIGLTRKISQNKTKQAFTLAEVLITLVIIGVVAAMAIPVILQSTGRHESVTRLKKANSVLGQAIYRIAMDEGASVGDYSFMANDDFFDAFSVTVNTIKICKNDERGCFSLTPLKELNGSNWANYNRENSLVTNDGMAYGWDKNYCGGKGLSAEDLENCIGRFIVDINGDGMPNRFGYDIFFFLVVNGKGIVPAGSGNNSADCRRGSSGITCAAKVLRDGEINYL